MIEINGTPGNDNLVGTGEADVIFALTGDDIISGFGGDDSLFGFEGNDTINGNEGNDTLFGNQNFDLLIGDSGDDWLFGGKEGDIIEDGEGEDQLFGNLGDDLLQGGAGNDKRYGGQANDTVIGGTGNDEVFGDRGNDILWGVDINAVNPGIDEIDILTGGSEQDIFVLGDESRLYYIGSGNNDFALITDFNGIEDQINVGNNQVTYTETVLNELGLGVAILSQNNDLIAFVQNATINQFITGSNVVELPQTNEAIPRQEELQFPEVVPSPDPVIVPTPTPVVITPTPTPTPDPIITPTPTPVVITPTPTPTPDPVTPPTPTPDPVTPPTPTPDPVFTPIATPDPIVTPTPTPVVITPTPTPDPVFTPIATPDPIVTPTPTPVVITPTPTPDPIVTPTPTPVVITPTPTPVVITPTPTPDPVFTPTPTPDPVFTPTPTPEPVFTPTPDPVFTPTPTPNTPPVAINDNYTTPFDSPIFANSVPSVLNNDTDLDGNTLTAILVNSPTNGSLNLNGNGSFSYTPNSEFSGMDSFTYTANDGEFNSNIATVTINVEPRPNTPPVADNDNYTTGFQSPITVDASVGVLNNDSDLDGDPITTILVNPPKNGNVSLNENGSFSYTPNSGFSGVDSFTYIANDGKSDSNVGTVTIDVEHTRSLNSYSQRDFNDTDIYSTFLLTGIGDNGQIIIDQNDSDEDLGFFPKAIQDFITYDGMGLPGTNYQINLDGETELFGEGSNVTLNFDEEGQPIFTGLKVETEITPVVDLRVRLIEREQIEAEFELTKDEVDEFEGEIIVFEFLNSESEEPFEQLFLFTKNDKFEDQPDIDTNLETYSLTSINEQKLLNYTFTKSDAIDFITEEEVAPIDSLVELESVSGDGSSEKTYYSQRIDDRIVLKTFSVANDENEGKIIDDENSNTDSILFPGAVQDFITYNTDSGRGITLREESDPIIFDGETPLFGYTNFLPTLSFDEEGQPIFTGLAIETELIPVVDLRVRLIKRDDIITEFELTDDEDNPIIKLDDSFPEEIVIYEFFEAETDNLLEELVFSTELPNIANGDLPNKPISLNLATNSLEYIIDQDLLAYAEGKSNFILEFLYDDDNILNQEDVKDLRETLIRDAENPPINFVELEKAEFPLISEQTYSQREIDNMTVQTTFLFTNNADNYQTINDQDDSDTRSYFPETIQDFITYNNNNGIQLSNLGDTINFNGETELIEEDATLKFNGEGEPIFTGVEVETEITPVVDLRVKFIERDDIIAELKPTDGEGNPIVELDDSFEGDIIVYEFLDSETETVLEELFLFTDEFPELEDSFSFSFEFSDQPDKANLATNSLESIIEEDLLSFALKENDAIQVILGELTPSEARSSGESFVNPED